MNFSILWKDPDTLTRRLIKQRNRLINRTINGNFSFQQRSLCLEAVTAYATIDSLLFLSLSEPGKEKIAVRAPGITKSPRKFAGVVIAMCGLPGRGKSQVAQCLSRRLNWNGDTAKGGKSFSICHEVTP